MGTLTALLTIAFLLFAFALFVISILTKKYKLAFFAIGSIVVWFVIYFAILFGFSFTSRKTYLLQNTPKRFCGFYFDSHIQASVTDVKTTNQIGAEKAQGIFYIITVRLSSDAKRQTLSTEFPEATLIDEGPRLYSRREKAENELYRYASFPSVIELSPTENYEQQIVFDITEPAQEIRLSLTNPQGIDRYMKLFLIGDEDSLFHEPTLFIIKTKTKS